MYMKVARKKYLQDSIMKLKDILNEAIPVGLSLGDTPEEKARGLFIDVPAEDNKAVQNISFKIGENEIVGLLGPNGCGKTTTIAMLLGLLKPTSGQILIDGISIENNRIELLHKMNFISPYIELPKKLTVK